MAGSSASISTSGPHNRAAIEAHPMASRIALIEGSSTAPEVLRRVDERIVPDERVLVVLDSNHGRDHVLAELRAYARFLAVGGRMVAADGIMQDLAGAPRSEPTGPGTIPSRRRVPLSPRTTASSSTSPSWLFNEGSARERVTYWPGLLRDARALTAGSNGDSWHESGDPGGRNGLAARGGNPAPSEADGRDRRPSDPVAHHDGLQPPRPRRLHRLRRLQERPDQGIFRQLHPPQLRPSRRSRIRVDLARAQRHHP